MKTQIFPLSSIFSKVNTGDVHSSSSLDNGSMPLLSCKTDKSKDHGVEGFFETSDYTIHENGMIITSDGHAGTASFHNHKFIAKDNVLVCIPKEGIYFSTILYAIAYINSQKWRFSYGRKCYENKIDKITIQFPITNDGKIDEDFIKKNLKSNLKDVLPEKNEIQVIDKKNIKFTECKITTLFDLNRGDFHSISVLAEGNIPTVSRTSQDNGITGYFEIPTGATKYPSGTLTVSTVSGEVFVQTNSFIATDNVLICIPKKKLALTTLFFIQFMLNNQMWRYSYGRQCYKTKYSETTVFLPVDEDGNLNEKLMGEFVKNTHYWEHIQSHIEKQ